MTDVPGHLLRRPRSAGVWKRYTAAASSCLPRPERASSRSCALLVTRPEQKLSERPLRQAHVQVKLHAVSRPVHACMHAA